MFLIQILPLTKIPYTQPQILSYFSGQKLFAGSLIQIPLGKRKANGVVIGVRAIADHKMEIKRADFELRNIAKIISAEPVLTEKQIKLALFLGRYYFASPGLFAKMMLTRLRPRLRQGFDGQKGFDGQAKKSTRSVILRPKADVKSRGDHVALREGSRANTRPKPQTLVLVPTISQAYSSSLSYPSDSVLWHSELTQKQKNETWLAVKTGQAQTIIGTRSAVFLPFIGLKKIIIVDESNPNHKSWDMFPHYRVHEAAQKLTEIFKAKLTIPAGRGYSLRATTPSLSAPRILRGGTPPYAYSRAPLNPTPTIIDMRAEIKGGNFSIFSVDLYEAVKNALAKKKRVVLFINRRGAANFILCRDCGYIAKCPNCDAPLAYHLINNKPSLLCHHCGAKDTPPSTCPKCNSWRIKTVGSGTQKVETETQKFFPDAKILRLDSDNAPKPKDQQKIIADFIDKKADVLIATQIIFSWLTELTLTKPEVVAILSADTLLHLPDFRSGERTWQTIAILRQLLNNNKQTFIIQTYNPDNSVLKYLKNNDYEGFIKEDLDTRQALNYPPFSQIVKLTFRHRDPKIAGQEAKILAVKLKNVIASSTFAGRSNPEYSKNNLLTFSPQTCPASRERRGEGGLRWGVEKQNSDTTSPQPPPQLRRGGKNDIEISPALPAFLPRAKGKYIWNIIIKFKLPFSVIPTPPWRGKNLSEFLQRRNSLLQYIPSNWEIDVDPENLL